MKYSEIIRNIDDIFDYFKFHSKNMTEAQAEKLHALHIKQEETKA